MRTAGIMMRQVRAVFVERERRKGGWPTWAHGERKERLRISTSLTQIGVHAVYQCSCDAMRCDERYDTFESS